MKNAMKTTATAPSAKAIGAPDIMKSSVTAANVRPSVSIDISVALHRRACAVDARDDEDRELQREQRHPHRHQRVRDPERRSPRRRRRLLVDPRFVQERPRLPREEGAEREAEEVDEDASQRVRLLR